MLGVAMHWARLLFWPAHLQADYGPREISAANGWQAAQWLGTLVIVVWAALLVWSRRRLPTLTFALLWIAIAIFPVSNIIVPTGVVLAERTLFLASAGASLAVGVVLAGLWQSARPVSAPVRWAAAAGAVILLVLGLMRSASLTQVWKTQASLLEHTVIDAPRSYGAHLALARFLDDSGKVVAAQPHFRAAAALNPLLADRERTLGDRFRLNGLCRPAVRHYRLTLVVRPEDTAARASTVACLLDLGRYAEVRGIAEPGLTDPTWKSYLEQAIREADSALAAKR
jgi:hypothetical protein